MTDVSAWPERLDHYPRRSYSNDAVRPMVNIVAIRQSGMASGTGLEEGGSFNARGTTAGGQSTDVGVGDRRDFLSITLVLRGNGRDAIDVAIMGHDAESFGTEMKMLM
ncbi:hypothetical protein JIP62_14990 [Brevundimonas vitis]|uniref:Uncharacterized protein n=1 Tax=Brevundimonas vitisensis TaxID=2800818 RepID=A0ABX7BPA2_9CAUL|nr:hypothetical protein [Brevundimonas vitisensis]QQQ18568.1 hypothetical protein JIP62_14990 [Brevundimonas vitisensis]